MMADEANGVQATAVATLTGNAVGSVTITESGSGYTNSANVTVSLSFRVRFLS